MLVIVLMIELRCPFMLKELAYELIGVCLITLTLILYRCDQHLLFFFFFFLIIRRPPRSPLFPLPAPLPIWIPDPDQAEDGAHYRRQRKDGAAGPGEAPPEATSRPEAAVDGRECSPGQQGDQAAHKDGVADRKSTRLNSSHLVISYAVFCLIK